MGAFGPAARWLPAAVAVLVAGALTTALLVVVPSGVPAVALVVTVGAASTVLLARAALRGGASVRPPWGVAAVTMPIWTASLCGALLGWDEAPVWWGLRVTGYVTMAAALLTSP